jgi:zinc protease
MTLRQRLATFLALAVVACGSTAHRPQPATPPAPPPVAATPPPAPTPTPADPMAKVTPLDARIRTGTLPNGLTYYVFPHKQPRARAQLWLAVNAGSVLEDDDQRGLAHLVEHMAFNGTKHFPRQAIVDFIEKSGMKFGADVNAYTSFDQTVYMLTVPTDDKKVFDTGLDVLRDWAGDLAFLPDEVEKERGVVLEEWRLGRGPFMRIFDKQAPVLFHDSRYADRITIGLPEIIEHAPRATLMRFYKDWYRPDLEAVIAVGDFDPDQMVAAIKAKFGDLEMPAHPRKRIVPPVPHDHPLLVSIETDKEMPFTRVEIYDKVDHRPERTLGDYRRFTVENLYHAMLNDRFRELSRKPGGPFTAAFSGTEDVGRADDALVRGAQARAGHAEEALRGLVQEVVRVERHGFSASELERAKQNMLRNFERSAKEHDKTRSRQFADEITRLYFTDEQMPGSEVEYAMVKQLLPGITLAEENQLAASTSNKGRVVMVSGPAASPLPSKDEVVKIVEQIEKSDVPAWDDKPPPASLMAKAPAPGKITKERTIQEIGVTEWTLSNGAKVVIKPTDFKNDDVELSAFSPGGTSRVPTRDFDSARFAASVVADGGVADFDPVALDKALTGKVARVSPWISELEEGLSGNASPDDLETFMQLVYLRFTAPRRDEDAFKAWQDKTRDWAAHRRLLPESAFFEDMDSFVSSHHKRRAPITPEVVDKVSLDKALAIYKDRFADADDFTFVFVGNVDLAKLRPLVETYLASLPTRHRREKWRDVGVRFPHGKKNLNVTKGEEPKSFVYLAQHANARWNKTVERDLEMLQMMLSIRLREVLREDMSGVYFVQVWADISRRPRQEREFGVFFGCSPDNVDKLVAATDKVVKTVQKDGLGEVYLDKVKEQIVRVHETDLRENRYWVRELADAWRFGDDPKDILTVKPLLDRVTPANVKAAARKYLSAPDRVLAVLRPAVATKPAAVKAPASKHP